VNEKVTQHFAWLFAHYAVQVHEYSEFHGSCRIVYLIDGVLLLQFITERGGVRWHVAPAGTDQQDAVNWVPPSDVVNFLTQQGPHYTGNMEYTLNTDRILGELAAELEPHMAQIVEFYRSADHVVRREEFQQFRKTYDEEFMRQVNEYYARRRGSPPLTPG
jgi:hypothetical protein